MADDPVAERIALLDTMRASGRIAERDYQAAVHRTREAGRTGAELPPLPSVTAAGGSRGGPPRPHGRALAVGLVAAVVLVVIVIAAANGSSSHGGKHKGSAEASFVAKIDQNAQAASSDATALVAEIEALTDDPSGLYQLAGDAKTLHDHLFDWRETLLGQVSIGNNDQMDFVNAENELKNSAGTVQSWAGDPNPSKTADLTSQFAQAVADWNASVRTIWRKAGKSSPPIIGLAGG